MRAPDLRRSLLLVGVVWTTLLAGSAVARPSIALPVSFAIALALVWAIRPAPRYRAPRALPWALGLVAGYAGFGGCVIAIYILGTRLGMAPLAPTPPGAGDPALWSIVLVLGPLLEELLYRERLLVALRLHLGPVAAVSLSSVAFALPHAEPFRVLGTAVVGLGLGALYLRSGSIALCIGVHAGLNAASVVCGVPPLRAAPPAASGLVVAVALLLVALRTTRRPRQDGSRPLGARLRSQWQRLVVSRAS